MFLITPATGETHPSAGLIFARRVADFSVEFKTLAADAGWDDSALRGTFLNGLYEPLQDEIAARDKPADFKTLVSLAIRLDNRLQGRRSQRSIP